MTIFVFSLSRLLIKCPAKKVMYFSLGGGEEEDDEDEEKDDAEDEGEEEEEEKEFNFLVT